MMTFVKNNHAEFRADILHHDNSGVIGAHRDVPHIAGAAAKHADLHAEKALQ